MTASDTIYALSSGALPSGVAVVRVSGPAARRGLDMLAGLVPERRRAVVRTLRDGAEMVDTAIVMFFPGPDSVTGEDVVEYQVHGGRAVVAALLDALSKVPGCRPAEAGEFTRRSFLNGRIDLSGVEGLADLVRAETEKQRRQAARQAAGGFRTVADGWRSRLIRARALVETGIDFVEEEIPASVWAEAETEVSDLASEIGRHLDDGHRGERVRDGLTVVLLGPPNVGKSSLLNALARRDVAIVTPEPGTTRDLIEVALDLGGYAVTLVDTAGLREAASLAEQEGTRRAEARAATADLVLWLEDVSWPGPSLALVERGPALLRVGTKADLIDSGRERFVRGGPELLVSAKTGAGLAVLVERLTAFAGAQVGPGEAPLITRQRHRLALNDCKGCLDRAIAPGLDAELRAEELRRATDALGRISGRIDAEGLLDVIFAEFCIGK
ncbi:MAG: tRNA uridine-5-carboxymethylaminomethyl(34) synthesis GTPase MnmE [Bauldia sp.]